MGDAGGGGCCGEKCEVDLPAVRSPCAACPLRREHPKAVAVCATPQFSETGRGDEDAFTMGGSCGGPCDPSCEGPCCSGCCAGGKAEKGSGVAGGGGSNSIGQIPACGGPECLSVGCRNTANGGCSLSRGGSCAMRAAGLSLMRSTMTAPSRGGCGNPSTGCGMNGGMNGGIDPRKLMRDQQLAGLLPPKTTGGLPPCPGRRYPAIYRPHAPYGMGHYHPLFRAGQLRDPYGKAVDWDDLKGLSVGIYFGADNLTADRAFLPRLVEWYIDTNESSNRQKVEIIFVSLDESYPEFEKHRTRMPWLTLAYEDLALVAELQQHFKAFYPPQRPNFNAAPVSCPPCLHIVRADGSSYRSFQGGDNHLMELDFNHWDFVNYTFC